ncbi:hypothetical protein EK21DRAFT_106277 [Setomelanomma holmii]|uniref:Uncharacterized protein n=1 Tax=Setomelanomma holmii TaxID=210430 RepID=A0A9P4HMB6_9PLEO|nr:hypothetical protein EK21DRAFT_106277 [Setomelanomma holmii]
MKLSLPDLPIELTDLVIDGFPVTQEGSHKRRDDLKSFRLVCREVERTARVRFGQEFFADLVVTARPNGFASTHGIVGDEIFRQYVRSLVLQSTPEKFPFDLLPK